LPRTSPVSKDERGRVSRNEKSGLKIFLVDDHPAVRRGLSLVLKETRHHVCGEAGDSVTALRMIKDENPDVMIVDLSLHDESGMDLLRELQSGEMRTIVYSMHEDAGVIRRAFDLGACAYVTKRDNVSALLTAVEEAAIGEQYVSPIAAQILSKDVISGKRSSRVDLLSAREKEIMHLVGRGAANEEIAAELGLTVRTIESYFARIIEKLGFEGMKALRRHAISKKNFYQL
jgi:DNA-binding NarL/FixJ family response regulator